MEKNVPINKGNYSLDTVERDTQFNEKRAFGIEAEYYKYRKDWEEFPKKQYVSQYPLLVDLELSTVCNLHCPFCYTITDEFNQKVSRRLMDLDLFRKIVNEIAGAVFAIRLSLRGEPTIHPQFMEAIRYARQKSLKEISTLTNGSRLTSDFFIECMHAGLDWITVSFDGLFAEYEKNRYPLKFELIYKNLAKIAEIKREKGYIKPVIKIQSVWPAIQNNPLEFYTYMSEVSDLVAFNPLIDFSHSTPYDKIKFEEDFCCPQPYQRLVVGSDGLVMACANDEDGDYIVGDTKEQTVFEIWHGEKMEKLRQLHKEKDGFKQMIICRKCYIPRKTKDVYYKIGNRDLIVRDYI
jgi:radical SAM protein with 4Fe4S-binding SPASM domain